MIADFSRYFQADTYLHAGEIHMIYNYPLVSKGQLHEQLPCLHKKQNDYTHSFLPIFSQNTYMRLSRTSPTNFLKDTTFSLITLGLSEGSMSKDTSSFFRIIVKNYCRPMMMILLTYRSCWSILPMNFQKVILRLSLTLWQNLFSNTMNSTAFAYFFHSFRYRCEFL